MIGQNPEIVSQEHQPVIPPQKSAQEVANAVNVPNTHVEQDYDQAPEPVATSAPLEKSVPGLTAEQTKPVRDILLGDLSKTVNTLEEASSLTKSLAEENANNQE